MLKGQQQAGLTGDDQARFSTILHAAYKDVKDYYYDPKIRGLDWEARYEKYKALIGRARNVDDGMSIVAAFLGGLDDSHTYFIPPARTSRFDSGYRSAVVGDNCFITHIRPNTEAAEKLKVGDRVIALDGFKMNRADFHDANYFFEILTPRAAEQLDLRSPSGEQRRVVVNGIVRPAMPLTNFMDEVRREQDVAHTTRSRVVEMGDGAIWKLQRFAVEDEAVEKAIGIARKHDTLILDLRGNPGGPEDTLKMIVGLLFDHDVKIGDRVVRKETKPMVAKHRGSPFTGKLIVLVDGGTASAAEILTRVVQLEHRGTVIGDRTAGAVMGAMLYRESVSMDGDVIYGFSVTMANLIMGDGKSLEKTGVVPDETVLPTGANLAAGRDPVLARAAELAGVKLDATEAGKLFPFEWAPI
jgi:carboxyl-terminal processing protease